MKEILGDIAIVVIATVIAVAVVFFIIDICNEKILKTTEYGITWSKNRRAEEWQGLFFGV